jgi:hypothetical protein
VIKIALRTTVAMATIAGATFAAATPAHADGIANDNNVIVEVIAPVVIPCNSVAVGGEATSNCNH